MKLYTAQCYDRHIDPVIRVFDTADAAIAFAKAFVKYSARHPDSIEEETIAGWLYFCRYGEDDRVLVQETELNDSQL